MFTSRWFRVGVVGCCLGLIAIAIGGCLECRENIVGRYDADKDQFVFLNLFQQIGGQTQGDFAHLQNLWNNRDHLITPPFPNFFGKTSFLRLSNTKYAKLNLGGPGSVDVSTTPLPLDQVKVLPGQFFMQGKEAVGYYDQIVVPGTFADATLKLLNEQIKEGAAEAMKQERDRRSNGGKLVTWEDYRKAVATQAQKAAGPNDAAPPPAGEAALPDLSNVLSDASLDKLAKGLADGSIGVTREKAIFRVMIPLDENDAKEAMATISALRATMAQGLKMPAHDPDLDDEVVMLGLIESSSPRPGVIELSVDATKLFPRVEAIFKRKADQPATGDEAKHTSDALAAIKAMDIPIDDKLTAEQIVADFHAGKLQGHPPEKSVPPGEGLVERK